MRCSSERSPTLQHGLGFADWHGITTRCDVPLSSRPSSASIGRRAEAGWTSPTCSPDDITVVGHSDRALVSNLTTHDKSPGHEQMKY